MTMTRKIATATAALGLALSPILATAPALAQDTTPAAEAEGATSFSDTQLEAFVLAALDVAELRQNYQDRIEDATDAAAQQAIVDEANTEILRIVEESDGITVEEYIEIGQTAAADPTLNARIVALMQEEAPTPAE